MRGNRIAAILVLSALSACGGSSGPGGTSSGPEQGYVKGTARDTRGQPLAGASVSVCDPLTSSYVFSSCLTGTTDASGLYAVQLPGVHVYKAYGYLTRPYNGKTYCLPLEADVTDSFGAKDAAVRNFTWKLSGLKPGSNADRYPSSYYGAELKLQQDTYGSYEPARVAVSFAPVGPLIDGSTLPAFARAAADWYFADSIADIPLGRYGVEAVLVNDDRSLSPLLVATETGAFGSSAVIDFNPADGGTCGRPYATLRLKLP